MLLILVSRQLLEGLKEFLRATFPVTTPGFLRDDGQSFVDDFLRTEGALAKGPWLEVKLPFRRSEGAELPFARITLSFVPWQHQLQVFVAGLNRDIVPLERALRSQDPVESELGVANERSLLHVAATRAVTRLFLSCSGSPSEYLEIRTLEDSGGD